MNVKSRDQLLVAITIFFMATVIVGALSGMDDRIYISLLLGWWIVFAFALFINFENNE